MKKIKKLIKLTNLNLEHLRTKELKEANAGTFMGNCHCGCFYAACGGSSNYSNTLKNNEGEKVSPLPSADTECGIRV